MNELRGRAGTLVAAVAIGTSFLGTAALDVSDAGLLVAFGLAFFLCSMLSTIWVLLPKKDWSFESSAETLIFDWLENEDPLTEVEVVRKLALEWEAFSTKNQAKLDRLYWMFAGACVSLLCEIIFFGAAVARG